MYGKIKLKDVVIYYPMKLGNILLRLETDDNVKESISSSNIFTVKIQERTHSNIYLLYF